MDIHIETVIDAPAEKVWDVLAHQFASIESWASVVDRSRPIDLSEVPDGVKVADEAPIPGRETKSRVVEAKEVLVQYSESGREFTFSTVDLPPFLGVAENRSRVTPVGSDGCVLSFDIHVEPRGPFKLMTPLLKKRMTNSFTTVQTDLKVFTETGQISEAKRQRLEKLST